MACLASDAAAILGALRTFRIRRSRLDGGGIMVGMRRTLGYHIVVSGYGLWLPGVSKFGFGWPAI